MVIAFVPARGGSKSIPLKNIKLFCGKPLIYWCLKSLEESEGIDSVVVSTDSDIIKNVTASFSFSKVKVYDRDRVFAQDNSSTESAMLEFIEKSRLNGDDTFILVQLTSPFTTSDDFQKALEQYFNSKADSLLSVVKSKRFFWKPDGSAFNYDFNRRPRRQDFEGLYMENGAFYINKVSNIKKFNNRLSGKIDFYLMPEYAGYEIDDPDDWFISELLMKRFILNKRKPAFNIKLLITDVDGVLTDGGMYYSEKGDELKKFNTTDGKGIELLRKKGIKTAIITSEDTGIVRRRSDKLNFDFLFQGIADKLKCARELCRNIGISLNNVAYIGDDINDIELLSNVGYAACPANAVEEIKSIPGIIKLEKQGGEGALREFIDLFVNKINDIE